MVPPVGGTEFKHKLLVSLQANQGGFQALDVRTLPQPPSNPLDEGRPVHIILYPVQDLEEDRDFLESTLKFYQAELAAVDFCNESDEIRQQINAWAEAQTADKIKDLLAPNAIGSLTKLVLVNAIYFKGNWERKFEAESTHERPFKISKNETKPVQMMHQTDKFKTTYIHAVELAISKRPDKLLDCTNPYKMDNDEIVMLPKFKMENTYGFTSTLGGMRMVDVFDVSKANFLGMTEKNDLNLSKVVHKTFADVNEEGTEAAAATAVTMRLMCLMITMEFVADHPFLFFISHNKTHNILFFGRFSSP
eukprot:gi/632945267/ref/XP_007887956.1/ PREDICTED: serpin B6-like [Callorhinchus milii]